MKKIFLISGAALALGFAGASSAAALVGAPGAVGTLPGIYAGVGGGWGGMDTPKLTQTDLANLSAASGTYKIHKGVSARGYLGYLWAIQQVQNLQLGAELGYNHYPKNKYTVTNANNVTESWNYKGYTIDLLGVAKYNFGNTGFNGLLKVGPAYVRQKLAVTPATGTPVMLAPSLGASKGKVKAELAGGLGYDINQNIDVNVIVAHVFGSKPASLGSNAGVPTKASVNKVASVTTAMLSVAYHFGDLNM